MKFMIAGLGSIGRRHFRNLLLLGQKDIVLLRSHRATLPDDELAGYPVETDLAQALRVHKPDAVIVANPSALHLDVAIPAAEAGCHILLEKPVSNSLERMATLKQASGKSGSRILVGFQFRYHPAMIKARELVGGGRLGKLLAFRAHWGEYLPQWHPWEDYRQGYAARADLGGGVLNTLIHPFDYLRFMLGEVGALWAFQGKLSPLQVDVEDAAEVGLQLTGGAVGSVHVNFFQRPPVHRFEIVGTDGSMSWDNADGILHIQRMPAPFGTYSANPALPIAESFPPPAGFERNDLFIAQMKHFIKLVEHNIAPVCSLQDGVRALQMVLGAKSSSANGLQFLLESEPAWKE
jgi:predicted dehydrogenase